VTCLVSGAAAGKMPPQSVGDWFLARPGPLVGLGVWAGLAMYCLLHPSTMTRWVQESRPEISSDGRVVATFVRVICALQLAMLSYILASILS